LKSKKNKPPKQERIAPEMQVEFAELIKFACAMQAVALAGVPFSLLRRQRAHEPGQIAPPRSPLSHMRTPISIHTHIRQQKIFGGNLS